MVSLRSFPWNGNVPVSISNCNETNGEYHQRGVFLLFLVNINERARFRTMRTPRDHQSALCVCPLLLTTSGAIYSTVPQKEYAFLSASTDSLLKPKSEHTAMQKQKW